MQFQCVIISINFCEFAEIPVHCRNLSQNRPLILGALPPSPPRCDRENE